MNAYSYYYTVLTRKFVKAGRVCLALVVRTTLLVGMVESAEVAVIIVVGSKYIGDEFED